jgi:alkanesulfonate monooxygenase SsuD/methylene tetrahydromethanopterin reductase-like flavin-dependent oxidoreductase (luciferase family)
MDFKRPPENLVQISSMGLTINDCGMMLEPQLGMSMDQVIGAAMQAEELGFGYFFRSDHLLPTNDRRGVDSPECWTSLGAVAASTSRIKFGPLVSPIGFRNPALLAKMACTLHSFSRGRLQLAVGAGWYEAEYRAHGFLFPDFRIRLAQFREALDIITVLVNTGRVDYDGKYFTAHTDCLPRPAGHMHLTIGGRAKSVIRLAGRLADEWNFVMMSKDEMQGLYPVLRDAARGRSVEVTEMGPFMIAKTKEKLEEYARLQISKLGMTVSPGELFARLKGRDAPCGTVDEVVRQLAAKRESGVQRVYFQTLVPENNAMTELLVDTLKAGI